MKNVFEPSELLSKNKLIELGLSENELRKPLIGIFYEDGCKDSAINIREGIFANDCASICFPVSSISDYIGLNKNLFYLREAVCSLIEGLTSLYCLNGAVIVCQNELTLAGASLAFIKNNIPFCVFPSISRFFHRDILCALGKVRSGKTSLYEIDENNICISRSCQMDNVNSLFIFFEALGIAIKDCVFTQNKSERIENARKTGQLISKKVLDLIYPKKELTLEAFNNALEAYKEKEGTFASLIHILEFANQNGINLDLERAGYSHIKGNIAKTAYFRKKDNRAVKAKAFVYEDGDSAINAIYSGAINEGYIIVLRANNVFIDLESSLRAMELENIIILTDSRMIELDYYPAIFVTETADAFELIQNGDTIEVDFKKGKLNLDVANKEIAVRQKRIR